MIKLDPRKLRAKIFTVRNGGRCIFDCEISVLKEVEPVCVILKTVFISVKRVIIWIIIALVTQSMNSSLFLCLKKCINSMERLKTNR